MASENFKEIPNFSDCRKNIALILRARAGGLYLKQ